MSHFSYLRLYFERQIRCELLREAAPQSDPNIYLKSGVLLSLQEQPPQRVRFAPHEKTPVLPAFRLPFRGTLHFRHQTRGFPPAERVPTAPAAAPRVSRALTLPTGDAATVPGYGRSPARCSTRRPSLRMPGPSPAVTEFLTGGCRFAVPTTPSSGLINLLEQLTEPREALYSLGHWCIVKDATRGQPDGRRWGPGRGPGPPGPLRGSPFPQISTCSPAGSSLNPIIWGFL